MCCVGRYNLSSYQLKYTFNLIDGMWVYSCKYLLIRSVWEMARWRPTAPPCCWWSLKCQLVVGDAAWRSVSGSTRDLGTLLWCADWWHSAHAQLSTAHWTVYGVVRGRVAHRGAHSCTLLPCNNRKWAAAAKNNLNVWLTDWLTDWHRVRHHNNSRAHHGITALQLRTVILIQCDTTGYIRDRVTISENCNSVK